MFLSLKQRRRWRGDDLSKEKGYSVQVKDYPTEHCSLSMEGRRFQKHTQHSKFNLHHRFECRSNAIHGVISNIFAEPAEESRIKTNKGAWEDSRLVFPHFRRKWRTWEERFEKIKIKKALSSHFKKITFSARYFTSPCAKRCVENDPLEPPEWTSILRDCWVVRAFCGVHLRRTSWSLRGPLRRKRFTPELVSLSSGQIVQAIPNLLSAI